MPRTSSAARLELWRQRLQRYGSSGQTVAVFCQQEHVSVPAFYYWKRRLAESPATTTKPSATASVNRIGSGTDSGFTELLVREDSVAARAQLPGGITISLGCNPQIATLIVDRLLRQSERFSDSDAKRC